MKKIVSICAAGLLLAGCDMLGGGSNTGVAIKMEVAGASGSNLRAGHAALTAADEGLVLVGTNGTLAITDVRLIVDQFRLKRDKRATECDGKRGDDDDACEHFSAPPTLVDLPLGGEAITVATTAVPSGTYDRLHFRVKDLDWDDDDDRDDDDRELDDLAEEILEDFPNWPEDASMMLVGTFTPTGGTVRPFTVFADADIKVMLGLNPPLVISDDEANRDLTIQINPALWFRNVTGAVMDLSAYDYTGDDDDLLEFKLKIKDGFTQLKYDGGKHRDKDDDDDDDHGRDD